MAESTLEHRRPMPPAPPPARPMPPGAFLSNAGPVIVTISGEGDSGCRVDFNGDGFVDFLDYWSS